MYVHRYEHPEPNEYWVVVGEHNRDVVEGTERTHLLELIHQHPDYNSYTNDNDLALLKMKEPIEFNRNVGPLTIEGTPIVDDDGKLSCYVTGWGSTHSKWIISPGVHSYASACISRLQQLNFHKPMLK